MSKITILLVDDHKLIRDSWCFILNNDPRFHVIGESGSGDEAIEFTKHKKPQIVLMDVNMNPVNGFDATKQIRKISPGSKVIGISNVLHASICKTHVANGSYGLCYKKFIQRRNV